MRILFITSTRIGDAVLGSGILAHLIDVYGDPRITIACGLLAAPLFASVPGLERLLIIAKKPWKRHWLDLWREVVRVRSDLVVDLRGSALSLIIPARARKMLSFAGGKEHCIQRFSRTVGAPEAIAPRIFLPEDISVRAWQMLPLSGPILALGPTSNSLGKQWPGERFAALADRLTRLDAPLAGASFLVLGGPGEREAARPLLDRLDPARTTAFLERSICSRLMRALNVQRFMSAMIQD